MLAVRNARIPAKLANKTEHASQITANSVTTITSAHAVITMPSHPPLQRPSAPLVSPFVVPGVPALDVKPMAVLMTITAP